MFIDHFVERVVPWRFRSRNNFAKAHANFFFRPVQRTPPLGCPEEADTEIHSLVCKRDTNMLLVAAKSFLRHVPQAALVIHEDGTLDEADCALLRHHLPGARLVRRRDADRELAQRLPPDVMARRRDGVFLLKLFDFNHFSRGRKLIALDSDIVFLRRPEAVIEWMCREREAGAFYNQDPSETFRAAINPGQRSLPPNFNAGFMGFEGPIELGEMEHAMRAMNYWREDQTIYAWLLAARNVRALPRPEYFVFDGVAVPPQACMVHFINPVRFTTRTYIDVAANACKALHRSAAAAA